MNAIDYINNLTAEDKEFLEDMIYGNDISYTSAINFITNLLEDYKNKTSNN